MPVVPEMVGEVLSVRAARSTWTQQAGVGSGVLGDEAGVVVGAVPGAMPLVFGLEALCWWPLWSE